ncbi:LLM class flavin-dependent oxidoreductase [Mycolicibacterium agri]|nr:LLM class flavin-dependent oxidoreductase [Mycolicibacterium agri]GFG50710.1 N5,N10-methylene tetrahydromethanopterin reductase [Mycolicibacterium agri]
MSSSEVSSRPGIQFGLSLPNRAVLFGLPAEELIEAGVSAENTGLFGSLWVGDNLLSKPRLESVVTLTALAMRTHLVRLGTISMATFAMRNPVFFAAQWASLDLVSGGRTILSVCNGGAASASPRHAAELAVTGVASNERVARLEEGIEIVRRCWADGTATYNGTFYQFEDIEVLPKPAQPKIPIIIAVSPAADKPKIEERALRRVARLADGWQTVFEPVDRIARRWQDIQRYADEYGRAGEIGHLSQHIMIKIDDDADRGMADGTRFLRKYYGEKSWQTSAQYLPNFLAAGPPSQIADWITRRIDAGVNVPVVRFVDIDQDTQLERFCAEVVPSIARHADISRVEPTPSAQLARG